MLKQSLIFTGKLFLAMTILYWLYQSDVFDPSVLKRLTFDTLTLQLLLLNFLLILCGAVLVSVRMWYLLRLLDVTFPLGDTLRVNLAAMCMGMMLPGLVGVDAVRLTYFCMREKDRKLEAFSAVLFDRLLGIFALLLLACISALGALAIGLDAIPANLVFFLLATLGLMIGTILLLSSKTIRESRFIGGILLRLPAILKSVIEALRHFVNHKQAVFFCLGISVVSQATTVLSFAVVGILIRDTLPVLAHFIINPVALLLNGVPLTPGGLGITESAFAYLYQTANSANGATISLLGRLNQYLVYAIIGIPALFLIRR